MKELVYKTLDGNNPRKKEVSIQEIEDCKLALIDKKWTCKYFIREYFVSRNEQELQEWMGKHQEDAKKVKTCNVLKEIDTRKGTTKIVCKVMGEFFAVNGMAVMKIAYMNSLKILMSSKKGRKK